MNRHEGKLVLYTGRRELTEDSAFISDLLEAEAYENRAWFDKALRTSVGTLLLFGFALVFVWITVSAQTLFPVFVFSTVLLALAAIGWVMMQIEHKKGVNGM